MLRIISKNLDVNKTSVTCKLYCYYSKMCLQLTIVCFGLTIAGFYLTNVNDSGLWRHTLRLRHIRDSGSWRHEPRRKRHKPGRRIASRPISKNLRYSQLLPKSGRLMRGIVAHRPSDGGMQTDSGAWRHTLRLRHIRDSGSWRHEPRRKCVEDSGLWRHKPGRNRGGI